MLLLALMNLNDIKGIIEVNGKTYDPKNLIQAIIDQGMKIRAVNDSLLIGRTFIDPSPGLPSDSTSCPIVDHCKIFDKLSLEAAYLADNSAELSTDFPSLDIFPSFQSDQQRSYVDRIEVNDDDLSIQNLSSLFDDPSSLYDDQNQNTQLNMNRKNLSDIDSTEMVGHSPLTRYGPSTRIESKKIPLKFRGTCPQCSSTINVKWKYCACCGGIIR